MKIVDLDHAEMSEGFIDMMLWTMNTLVPLDGGPECSDLWHALCGA